MLSIALHVAYFSIAFVCWVGLYVATRIYARQNPEQAGIWFDDSLGNLVPTAILAVIWPALPIIVGLAFANKMFEQALDKFFPKK